VAFSATEWALCDADLSCLCMQAQPMIKASAWELGQVTS